MKRAKGSAYFIVQADGSFRCADALSRDVMRRKKLKAGDIVRGDFTKPRDYTQWKRAHSLGKLLAQNIEDFSQFDGPHPDAHGALKHLQGLSGVACTDVVVKVPGSETIVWRTAQSLAFGEMDETEFQPIYSGFCAYIIKRWWPTMDEAEIEQMASLVGMGG